MLVCICLLGRRLRRRERSSADRDAASRARAGRAAGDEARPPPDQVPDGRRRRPQHAHPGRAGADRRRHARDAPRRRDAVPRPARDEHERDAAGARLLGAAAADLVRPQDEELHAAPVPPARASGRCTASRPTGRSRRPRSGCGRRSRSSGARGSARCSSSLPSSRTGSPTSSTTAAPVWALSMRFGSVVWRVNTGAKMAVVARGRRRPGDRPRHGRAHPGLRPEQRQAALGLHVGSPVESSPVVHDGVDYFGSWNGVVYALDLKTHRLRWTYSLRRQDHVERRRGRLDALHRQLRRPRARAERRLGRAALVGVGERPHLRHAGGRCGLGLRPELDRQLADRVLDRRAATAGA